MKKIITLLLLVLFMITTPWSVFGKDSSKQKQVTGIVTSIDAFNNSFVIRNKKKTEFTIYTDDKTRVKTAGESRLLLSSIRVWDRLTVRYEENGGKNVATTVAFKPAKRKKRSRRIHHTCRKKNASLGQSSLTSSPLDH